MSLRLREESRVVLCLFLMLFVGVADNQVLSPLLPAIRSEFGKSSYQSGLLITGYSFCAGLLVLVWGPLSDVFGRKKGLVNGLLIFAAGSCVSFLAPSFPVLMAGRIVTGMGAGMLSLNIIAYSADYFPYSRRGWAMGAIFSSYFAALILGVPLGSVLGEWYGWKSVFGSMGAASVAMVLLAGLILPRLSRPDAVIRTNPVSDHVRKYLSFFSSPTLLSALISSFFASAGTTGFLAFLGIWLYDTFGVSGDRSGLVFIVAGTAALVASPLAGSVADRIGKALQFVLSSLVLALLLLFLPNFGWGTSLFAIFGGISLAAAFRQGPMEAILSEVVSSESRGAFVALKNSFSQLGIGLAALFSGFLFEAYGYSAVCLAGALCSVLAAAAMMFASRTRDF